MLLVLLRVSTAPLAVPCFIEIISVEAVLMVSHLLVSRASALLQMRM